MKYLMHIIMHLPVVLYNILWYYSLATLIWHLASATWGLCSYAGPEESALAKTIVREVFNSNSLWIQNLNAVATDVVAAFRECATSLSTRWLKLLGDVNISKIILIVKIVNREPLDFCHLFTIWQSQGKIFIVVAIQYIGPVAQKENVLGVEKRI